MASRGPKSSAPDEILFDNGTVVGQGRRSARSSAYARRELEPESTGFHKFLIVGLAALLVADILMFGGVTGIAKLVLRLGATLLLSSWFIQQIWSGELDVSRSPLFLPMAGFALVAIAQLAFGMTAYRFETTQQVLTYVAYAEIAFLAVQVIRVEEELLLFVSLLAGAAFCIAVFGIVQSFTFNGKIYWVYAPSQVTLSYGPYVNRNHYAGLMEMLMPLPLALALRRGSKLAILAGFAALVIAASVFLSGSRGGMLSITAGGLLFGVAVVVRSGSRRTLLGVLIFAAAITVMVGTLGSLTAVADKLMTIPKGDVSSVTRIAITRDSMEMIARKPMLGWGLGTFPIVYPMFRSFYTDLFVNQAHDDVLQMLIETGTLGLAAVLAFVATLFWSARRAVYWRFYGFCAPLQVGLLCGCCALMIHSFVDFNLQIPANAAVFYVLAVLACVDLNGRRDGERHPSGALVDVVHASGAEIAML